MKKCRNSRRRLKAGGSPHWLHHKGQRYFHHSLETPLGVMSNLCHVKEEPREKAAADDDDNWFSWHDPLIGRTAVEL